MKAFDTEDFKKHIFETNTQEIIPTIPKKNLCSAPRPF